MLDGSGYGCEFESDFVKAYNNLQAKEYSAWIQIAHRTPFCFSVSTTPTQEWTVLQVRGKFMQIAQTTFTQTATSTETQ